MSMETSDELLTAEVDKKDDVAPDTITRPSDFDCGADGGQREEDSAEDSDMEGEDAESEDEEGEDDLFLGFDEQMEPNPHQLHRNHSLREPMVPFDCSNAEEALQHLVQVFEERYGPDHPHFYIGTLEDAVKEVTSVRDSLMLKPLLIFIHSDKSIMAHVFCSEVLCSKTVVDYLNTNFITWPWDITNIENKKKLMEMIEECFDRKPLSDKEKEDQSFHVHPPWFKQPFDETRPHHHQSHAQPLAEHMTPSEVILQLVSNADDLPACLIFYPVAGQPHSIQGTWLASKGGVNMLASFHEALVSSVDNYKFLLQQSEQLKEGKEHYEQFQQRHHQWRREPLSNDLPALFEAAQLSRMITNLRQNISAEFISNSCSSNSLDRPTGQDDQSHVDVEQPEAESSVDGPKDPDDQSHVDVEQPEAESSVDGPADQDDQSHVVVEQPEAESSVDLPTGQDGPSQVDVEQPEAELNIDQPKGLTPVIMEQPETEVDLPLNDPAEPHQDCNSQGLDLPEKKHIQLSRESTDN